MGLTVRLRLTLLYGALSLLAGAGVLAITYLLIANSVPNIYSRQVGGPPGGPDLAGVSRDEAAQQRETVLHLLLKQSVYALAIMAVVAALLGWLVAGRVLRPLRTMTAGIQSISARNLHERLAIAGPRDELKDLADTVDGLLGRLEAALDSHRRFVANAAHELRTPLTLEHALLEEAVLDPDATAESFRAQYKELMVVSEQQARLLDSLLVLATSERGLDRRESVDLAALTGDVLRAFSPDVVIEADLHPAWATGDSVLIGRLVANLVDNAIAYNVPGGRVEVATGDSRLSVTNTGPPVPPEMVERLLAPFQRLSRTAGEDGHHGLGLSIVQAITASHSAELTVRANPGGGLSVTVLFVPVV
ncbi:sensor histidine kinase [Actinoplanes sp. NPDC051513]|uniref:sensor histidine kinase n=1 Tax=Actinoplanes sp. NPDC051513 TaxID=3363908 RepID=UPI0037BDBEA8